MRCVLCGDWVETEEPHPADIGCFICEGCLDDAELDEYEDKENDE